MRTSAFRLNTFALLLFELSARMTIRVHVRTSAVCVARPTFVFGKTESVGGKTGKKRRDAFTAGVRNRRDFDESASVVVAGQFGYIRL